MSSGCSSKRTRIALSLWQPLGYIAMQIVLDVVNPYPNSVAEVLKELMNAKDEIHMKAVLDPFVVGMASGIPTLR